MNVHNMLMAGSSREVLVWHWILPGGVTFEIDGASLIRKGEADGYRRPGQQGDPMALSGNRLSMPYCEFSGATGDYLWFGRFQKDAVQKLDATFIGPYGGFSGETSSVAVDSIVTGPTGNVFPKITFDYRTGFTTPEQYGDWSLDIQNPTAGSFAKGWQDWYSKSMSYPQGMIATRLVSYVFRLRNAGGPYVGACHDGTTFRYIPKPSDAMLKQLATDAGIYPPAAESIPSLASQNTDTFDIQLIRPVKIIDDEKVMVAGVIQHTGTLHRAPKATERPYYGSRRYQESGSYPTALLDAPMNWRHYGDRPPVYFRDQVSSLIFFTGVVDRNGFVSMTRTGEARSRSSEALYHGSAFDGENLGYVFKRKDNGEYDTYWAATNPATNFYEYLPDRPTYVRKNYVTPNGWKIDANIPEIGGVRDTRYMIIVAIDRPNYNALPPNPSGPNPPFDPPTDVWGGRYFPQTFNGMSYYSMTQDGYTQRQTTTYYWDPNSSAYRRPGQSQDAGTGNFAVSQWASKSVTPIKSAIGSLPAAIADPGGNPVMRLFNAPNGSSLQCLQSGQWQLNSGAGWVNIASLGNLDGTLSAVWKFKRPPPPAT